MKQYPNKELERMLKREIIRLYKRTIEQFNDAVPVIRCKDCKCWKPSMTDVTEHVCHWGGFRKNADDYCSWAERKEE